MITFAMTKIKPFVSTTIDLNTELSYEDRFRLLSLAEKISLLSGVSFTSTAGVKRLGIPSLKVSKVSF